jgi:signal recognition particle subunit SRP54
MQGLMEHMQDLATQNPDKQKEMAKKLEEGKLSIRDWREQINNIMNMYSFHRGSHSSGAYYMSSVCS